MSELMINVNYANKIAYYVIKIKNVINAMKIIICYKLHLEINV